MIESKNNEDTDEYEKIRNILELRRDVCRFYYQSIETTEVGRMFKYTYLGRFEELCEAIDALDKAKFGIAKQTDKEKDPLQSIEHPRSEYKKFNVNPEEESMKYWNTFGTFDIDFNVIEKAYIKHPFPYSESGDGWTEFKVAYTNSESVVLTNQKTKDQIKLKDIKKVKEYLREQNLYFKENEIIKKVDENGKLSRYLKCYPLDEEAKWEIAGDLLADYTLNPKNKMNLTEYFENMGLQICKTTINNTLDESYNNGNPSFKVTDDYGDTVDVYDAHDPCNIVNTDAATVEAKQLDTYFAPLKKYLNSKLTNIEDMENSDMVNTLFYFGNEDILDQFKGAIATVYPELLKDDTKFDYEIAKEAQAISYE